MPKIAQIGHKHIAKLLADNKRVCSHAHHSPTHAPCLPPAKCCARTDKRPNLNVIFNGNNTHTHRQSTHTDTLHTQTPHKNLTLLYLHRVIEAALFAVVATWGRPWQAPLAGHIPWPDSARARRTKAAKMANGIGANGEWRMANGNPLSYTLAYILMALWHAKLPPGHIQIHNATRRGGAFFAVVFQTFP